MNKKLKLMTFVLATALIAGLGFAKDKAAKKSDKEAAAANDEMMKKWAAYGTPGDAHKALAPMVGSFTHTSKMWMTPDAKPEETNGTTDAQWILGGRFVEGTVKGVSMGQPFEGRSIIGYDNEKKQYDMVWLDTMATGMMTSHGQYDAMTKTINDHGSASCPFEGTKSFRGMTKLIDDNHYSYELYTNGTDGKEFKMMEISYTRKSI